MIVALLVLSLAMIVGGLLAMGLGWDIVLLERGWAMVIAGSVSASGGAILLGLIAAISRLTRIHGELTLLRERAPMGDAPSPVIDPVSLVSSGLLGGAGLADRRPADRAEPVPPAREEVPSGGSAQGRPEADLARVEPPVRAEREARFELRSDLDAPFRPQENPPEEAPRSERDRRPPVLVADRGNRLAGPALAEVEARRPDTEGLFADAPETEEEDDFGGSARPDWARGAESEPPRPDWASGLSNDPQPSKPAPPPAVPAVKSTVIGTYTSGGNRYVMFADGSIEAETPDGTFTFSSLDELKEFIAAGGESGGGST
jgi:hypothetical protein